jgi:hypothetical protein
MSNDSRIFDAKIDPLFFSQVYEWLGASQMDLEDNYRFNRIRDIIDYVKVHPSPESFMRKMNSPKVQDRIGHVWEYINILREREELAKQLGSEEEKREFWEKEEEGGNANAPLMLHGCREAIESLSTSLKEFDHTLNRYEE